MAVLTTTQAACYLADAGWPSSVIPTVVAIGHPESGLRTDAVNPILVGGYHATGWLQVVAYPDRTRQWNLLDPLGNAQAALSVYRSQGLTAWSTYNDGSYLAYMAQVETELSGWNPEKCTGAGAGSSSSSAGALGISSAATSLARSVEGIGQVLLGIAVLGVAVLLVLSQTRIGATAGRAGLTAVKLGALLIK